MGDFLPLVHLILGPIEVPIHGHVVPVAIVDGILCLLEPLFLVEPANNKNIFHFTIEIDENYIEINPRITRTMNLMQKIFRLIESILELKLLCTVNP